MATFDSSYLLSLFNRYTGRPSTATGGVDSILDTTKYQYLSEAQNEVIADIASRAPHILYPTADYASYPQLSTVDNQVFTFGTDSNGFPITPIGKTGIYASLADIPNCPWREGWDYLNEGTQIRIPQNGSYSGSLWYRGIMQPADITATTQPVLFPQSSRELIALLAAQHFAEEQAKNPALAQTMEGRYNKRFAQWMLTWKTAFRSGGVLGPLSSVWSPVSSLYANTAV